MVDSPGQTIIVGGLTAQQFVPGHVGRRGGGGEEKFIEERVIVKIAQRFVLFLGEPEAVLE